MPRDPAELSHESLAHIVRLVQQWLYREELADGTLRWNLDKEWGAVDVCCDLAALLESYGLIPPAAEDSSTKTSPSYSERSRHDTHARRDDR
ncbi:MAG: hypothetical protein RH917_00445 [Lacipirellulaceae bacterium]